MAFYAEGSPLFKDDVFGKMLGLKLVLDVFASARVMRLIREPPTIMWV